MADAAVDAGVAISCADAGLDAGPRGSLPMMLKVTQLDGGVLSLEMDAGRIATDAFGALEITLPVVLQDYRVRFIDGSDAVMASDDLAEPVDGGLRYRIALQQPVKPGRDYSLVFDAQVGSQMTDVAGSPWDDVMLSFSITGPVSPEPARKKRH